jgi:acyl carrier protein
MDSDRSQILGKVIEVYALASGEPIKDITENTTFEDLRIDSLEAIDTIGRLERLFKIDIDDDRESFIRDENGHVGTVVDFIVYALNPNAPGASNPMERVREKHHALRPTLFDGSRGRLTRTNGAVRPPNLAF